MGASIACLILSVSFRNESREAGYAGWGALIGRLILSVSFRNESRETGYAGWDTFAHGALMRRLVGPPPPGAYMPRSPFLSPNGRVWARAGGGDTEKGREGDRELGSGGSAGAADTRV